MASHGPQGRFVDCQNYKNLSKKFIWEKEMPQMEQQLYIRIEDGREALWKPFRISFNWFLDLNQGEEFSDALSRGITFSCMAGQEVSQ